LICHHRQILLTALQGGDFGMSIANSFGGMGRKPPSGLTEGKAVRMMAALHDGLRHRSDQARTARRRAPQRGIVKSPSASGGVGVIGCGLVDGAKIIVYQTDCADREHDPQRDS
jgi:hypothetical protein